MAVTGKFRAVESDGRQASFKEQDGCKCVLNQRCRLTWRWNSTGCLPLRTAALWAPSWRPLAPL